MSFVFTIHLSYQEGAERNVMDDSVYNPLIHEKIIQFFETKFQQPRKNLIEYEWTGIMGFSVDGYPLVGEFQRDLFIGIFALSFSYFYFKMLQSSF